MAQKGGTVKGMSKPTMDGGFASKPTGAKGVGAGRGSSTTSRTQVPTNTNPRLESVRKSDAKAITRGKRNGPDK